MNILLLGSGGREHALAWKINQSKLLTKLYIIPGNAGTAAIATNVNISLNNFKEIGDFAAAQQIEMVIVGPEAPLVGGIKDFFAEHRDLKKIKCIGPNKKGAMLEGSKTFAKYFMKKYSIPTADSFSFTKKQRSEAYALLEKKKEPFVLKADGLASGKGVFITSDRSEAIQNLQEMFDGKFGKSGHQVLIEEYLRGIEISIFILTDGKDYLLFPPVKDYKQIGEGNKGINTGGMGAISPVPFANRIFMEKVEKQIINPTIEGLKEENICYQGFLFFGLMNVDGNPKVIEYNVRLGDPETEVIMPLLQSDLLYLLNSAYEGKLNTSSIELSNKVATTIMLVSGGYPKKYATGKSITCLDKTQGVTIFHAGTTTDIRGRIITNGGRVVSISALGNKKSEALKKAYLAAETIQFEKKYFRRDIGFDI